MTHRRLRFFLLLLVIAFAVAAILLRYTTYDSVVVVGSSMEPSLSDGDRLFANRRAYKDRPPQRGDVVVVMPGSEPAVEIKRVIAVGGDTVACFFGQLYINGQLVEETYIAEPMLPMPPLFPVTVPEGHVFVMGDNRNFSKDSRDWDFGPLRLSEVRGKAVFVFYPFPVWGRVTAPKELTALP